MDDVAGFIETPRSAIYHIESPPPRCKDKLIDAAPVSSDEVEKFGLRLCAACRRSTEATERDLAVAEAMKIYLLNDSVTDAIEFQAVLAEQGYEVRKKRARKDVDTDAVEDNEWPFHPEE